MVSHRKAAPAWRASRRVSARAHRRPRGDAPGILVAECSAGVPFDEDLLRSCAAVRGTRGRAMRAAMLPGVAATAHEQYCNQYDACDNQ